MSLDIRVIHEGPLYERLMTRWDLDHGGGYISAYVLFLATRAGLVLGASGVWYFPIVIGLQTGPPADRVRVMAERLLEATLRFISELDLGEPPFLELPDLDELWPKK